jgi:hypothetical protein
VFSHTFLVLAKLTTWEHSSWRDITYLNPFHQRLAVRTIDECEHCRILCGPGLVPRAVVPAVGASFGRAWSWHCRGGFRASPTKLFIAMLCGHVLMLVYICSHIPSGERLRTKAECPAVYNGRIIDYPLSLVLLWELISEQPKSIAERLYDAFSAPSIRPLKGPYKGGAEEGDGQKHRTFVSEVGPRNPSSYVGLALLCVLVGLMPRQLDSAPLS